MPEGSTVRWEFSHGRHRGAGAGVPKTRLKLLARHRATASTSWPTRRVLRSQPYQVRPAQRRPASTADPIAYQLTAVPDAPPTLTAGGFSGHHRPALPGPGRHRCATTTASRACAALRACAAAAQPERRRGTLTLKRPGPAPRQRRRLRLHLEPGPAGPAARRPARILRGGLGQRRRARPEEHPHPARWSSACPAAASSDQQLAAQAAVGGQPDELRRPSRAKQLERELAKTPGQAEDQARDELPGPQAAGKHARPEAAA
ncbi:MAG: hypothetical protein WKG07_08345 [Hymenobacter sp.]